MHQKWEIMPQKLLCCRSINKELWNYLGTNIWLCFFFWKKHQKNKSCFVSQPPPPPPSRSLCPSLRLQETSSVEVPLTELTRKTFRAHLIMWTYFLISEILMPFPEDLFCMHITTHINVQIYTHIIGTIQARWIVSCRCKAMFRRCVIHGSKLETYPQISAFFFKPHFGVLLDTDVFSVWLFQYMWI